MKKVLRCIICIISLIAMLVSIFYIAVTMSHGDTNLSAASEVTEINTPVDIGNAQYTFVNDNFIYVASEDSSIVQIFSPQGEYIKGILIPSGGGAVWMGTNAEHELYIYSVRKDIQTILSGDTYTTQYYVDYINPDDFHQKASIVNSDLCRRKGNTVFLNDGTPVSLNAPAKLYSLNTYIVIAILSFFVFMFASGIFLKMLENAEISVKRNVLSRKSRVRKK